jgi:hypothetical protein
MMAGDSMQTVNTFDRSEGDLGNIVALEHVNLEIPDQSLATIFYAMGMGFTRDPYLMTGVTNMWMNLGRNQFHLPTGKPMVLRGNIMIVTPSRSALLERLASVQDLLKGTEFSFSTNSDHVLVTCPWGNRLKCYEPAPEFGPISLGMPSIEMLVDHGSAEPIARFYREIMSAKAQTAKDQAGVYARVSVGPSQALIYREADSTDKRPYDNHHLQIYIADFSGPYHRLKARNLISREDSVHQYRFKDVIDLESGQVLHHIEHEIRSLMHPLYARPLINRNAEQNIRNFVPGQEAYVWTLA